MRPLVISDLDGTLADTNGLAHLVPQDFTVQSNFDAFNQEAYSCLPFEDVLQVVKSFSDCQVAEIAYVTARSERYFHLTSRWLHKVGAPSGTLIMRPRGDMRGDVEVKSDLFHAHLAGRYNPVLALEDRTDVADLWRSLSIPVGLVKDGYIAYD